MYLTLKGGLIFYENTDLVVLVVRTFLTVLYAILNFIAE